MRMISNPLLYRMYRLKKLRASSKAAQKGSVLFYILIAVALLAALSYAVASSSRSNSGGIDGERASLAASEILEYANTLGNAVTQLRLRGCTDTQISFENAVSDTDYTNGNAPGDQSCHVFNVAGGGVTYLDPKAEWLENDMSALEFYGENLFSGGACINQIGTGSDDCHTGGASAAELMLVLGFLDANLCSELNYKLGVTAKGDAPPVNTSFDAILSGIEFRGSYLPTPFEVTDSGHIIDGKRAACMELGGAPSGDYVFYKVLLAR